MRFCNGKKKAALVLGLIIAMLAAIDAAADTGMDSAGEVVVSVPPGSSGPVSGQGPSISDGPGAFQMAGGKTGPGAGPSAGNGATTNSDVMFGGGQLAMLTSQSGAQMLSCLLQSREGGLIVVDGGWEADADYLLQAIIARGGHVNAWLLTHPDTDHAGALYNLMTRANLGGIAVDHVYCTFGPQEWYDAHTPDNAAFVAELRNRLSQCLPQGVLVDPVTAGMEIPAAGIRTVVVNNAVFGESHTANSTGIVYRCEMNGVRIMFLGDLDFSSGELLLQRTAPEELKADIVQMAHHGQSGVGEDVYRAIGAKICLWPTPQWLWDNDNGGGVNSGPWWTLETRKWMDALGVRQNYVSKDGDIILR